MLNLGITALLCTKYKPKNAYFEITLDIYFYHFSSVIHFKWSYIEAIYFFKTQIFHVDN